MKYYSRQIEKVLKKAVKDYRIIVVTGARQTGKSTLLKHVFGSSFSYVTLDDPKILKLAKEDPELFFSEFKSPLIIDEIQYAPELLPYIKIIVDKASTRGQFIITGSQQFTLMKGLQETLAGRAVLFNLAPMSVFEGPKETQQYEFKALNGSYPEVVAYKNMGSSNWHGSYMNTYIEKDIVSHYRVEKITSFKNLVFLLAARTSQVLNYQSLSNDLGVSSVIVKSWIKMLEASQIIYLLKPYHTNLGSRIIKSPKLFFMDVGLAAYLCGIESSVMLFRSVQAGSLFENFVIQEIVKYYINQGKTPPMYYYRTNNGLEVDLIIEKKLGRIIPCEIKLSKTPNKGMISGITRFRKLNQTKNVTIENGVVISQASKKFPLTRTETVYPLKDFLNSVCDYG